MPLSEEELRLLEQMERALVEEDPKFASTLRGSSLRHAARRRAILAGVGFLAGIAVLMTGAILQVTPLGIAGFVIMLAMATIGVTALRQRPAASPMGMPAQEERHGFTVIEGGRSRRRGRSSSRTSGSFMERMEERWRRRRERGF